MWVLDMENLMMSNWTNLVSKVVPMALHRSIWHKG